MSEAERIKMDQTVKEQPRQNNKIEERTKSKKKRKYRKGRMKIGERDEEKIQEIENIWILEIELKNRKYRRNFYWRKKKRSNEQKTEKNVSKEINIEKEKITIKTRRMGTKMNSKTKEDKKRRPNVCRAFGYKSEPGHSK